jgi:putative transposase
VKIPLGLWDDSTENKTVTVHLLADLVDRDRDVEQGVLVVLDGSKALRAAVNEVFGAVPAQRCVATRNATFWIISPNATGHS